MHAWGFNALTTVYVHIKINVVMLIAENKVKGRL